MLSNVIMAAQLRDLANKVESGEVLVREFNDLQEVGKRMGLGDVYLPIGLFALRVAYMNTNNPCLNGTVPEPSTVDVQ